MPVDARGLALGVLAALASTLRPVLGAEFPRAAAARHRRRLHAESARHLARSDQDPARCRHRHRHGKRDRRCSLSARIRCAGKCRPSSNNCPRRRPSSPPGLSRMQISQIGNMQKMQSAATEVEKATTQAAAGAGGAASARHACHRGPTHVQARQLPVGEFDGRSGRHGSGGDGHFPDFLPAARRRYVQDESSCG